MNPKLIAKARSRLRIAAKAIDHLKAATNHQNFSDTWYTFLTAAKNVYTCLEQASKATAPGRQWFGGIKALRKSDELLQYLFQARDDEEHGVEAATELQPGALGIGVNKPGFSTAMHIRRLAIDQQGNVELDATSHDGKPILLEITPARSILKPVTGRGNRIYDPPTAHLGNAIPDNSPIPVAQLALIYLESLVDQAESARSTSRDKPAPQARANHPQGDSPLAPQDQNPPSPE